MATAFATAASPTTTAKRPGSTGATGDGHSSVGRRRTARLLGALLACCRKTRCAAGAARPVPAIVRHRPAHDRPCVKEGLLRALGFLPEGLHFLQRGGLGRASDLAQAALDVAETALELVV